MKIELTLERLEEIALCISQNNMSESEARIYVRNFAFECHENSVKQLNKTLGCM